MVVRNDKIESYYKMFIFNIWRKIINNIIYILIIVKISILLSKKNRLFYDLILNCFIQLYGQYNDENSVKILDEINYLEALGENENFLKCYGVIYHHKKYCFFFV